MSTLSPIVKMFNSYYRKVYSKRVKIMCPICDTTDSYMEDVYCENAKNHVFDNRVLIILGELYTDYVNHLLGNIKENQLFDQAAIKYLCKKYVTSLERDFIYRMEIEDEESVDTDYSDDEEDNIRGMGCPSNIYDIYLDGSRARRNMFRLEEEAKKYKFVKIYKEQKHATIFKKNTTQVPKDYFFYEVEKNKELLEQNKELKEQSLSLQSEVSLLKEENHQYKESMESLREYIDDLNKTSKEIATLAKNAVDDLLKNHDLTAEIRKRKYNNQLKYDSKRSC